MNSTEEQTAAELRMLVHRAAPAITAHPQLAQQVLAHTRASGRGRPWHLRRRTKVGASFAVVALAGAVAAGSLVGRSDYQKWIQPSMAMSPTVKVSQTVLVGKKLTPVRGDVVLLEADDGQDTTFELLSRVIGLPGDTVSCPAEPDGTCKAVIVSGQVLQEPWLTSRTAPFPKISVPAGHMFLLGDDRDAARDSRYIGPQRLDAVVGVVIARYNAQGQREALPGSPPHELPKEHENIDPAGPVPPSGVG